MSGGPLRGAIIGAGYFARFQAEAWRRLEGVEIAAVADAEVGRAEAFARQWEIPAAYGSAPEMLKREGPDFVDIVTRPETHLPLTALAAVHGAHVICQKPMAPTWDECVAMVRTCEEAGVRLLIHENWRWQPWYREMRRLIDSGTVGRPLYAECVIRTGDGRGPEPYPVQPYFREMERLLVYETLVHYLDTLRYLVGEIDAVSCRTRRINPLIRGEDWADLHLWFESGAGGRIDANRISGPRTPGVAFGRVRIEGEGGSVRLTPNGRLRLAPRDAQEAPHAFPTTDRGYRGDSVYATQEHLLHCLRTGEPAESEGRDYLRTAAAAFACYRSAEEGQAVVVAAG